MRSISADLLAAQKAPTGVPYVTASVDALMGAARRYDFTVLDDTAQAPSRHDACQPADGSLTRVRIGAGTINQQRIANPATGPYGTWSALVAGMGARVACSARGTRVLIVYTDAANTAIRYRESTNSGQTFSADALLVSPAAGLIKDLACAYKNTAGDFAVGWVNAANNVQLVKRTAGVVGGVATWPHAVADANGLAMTYGADYDMVLTGNEQTTSRATVWTLQYGDGGDNPVGTWGSLKIQVQGEGAQTSFGSPFLTVTDAYRMTFVEAPLYSGGTSRIFRSLKVGAFFDFGVGAYAWRTPSPMEHQHAEGMALAANQSAGTTDYIYETTLDLLQRAPRSIAPLDLTERIIAVRVEETSESMRGHLDLDNSDGGLAGPPAPIQLGNECDVRFGYYTAAGNATSRLPALYIAGWTHRRRGGRSILRLHLESGWDMLARSSQRTQLTSTADSYAAVLNRVCNRAGLELVNTGASARLTTTNPIFTIIPGEDGRTTVRRALSFLADRIRMRELGKVVVTEPLVADAVDYDFSTTHAINELDAHGEAAPVSWAMAFAGGSFGEAIDPATVEHLLAPFETVRDVSSASNAAATAVAHLRQRKLGEACGRIVCPPIVGLELYDVLQYQDPLVDAAAVVRRCMGIIWRYDRERAIYDQEITLGPR